MQSRVSSLNNDTTDPMLEVAAQRLLSGGLVAFPTETVYGLGADAENIEAVARIYAAKGRPANHPVIVHLPPGGDLGHWVSDVPREAQLLIDAFWPGPLTLILPRAENIPSAVSGGQDTIGVRCPSHPVAQALLHRFAQLKGGQGGVAAPSANLFGQVSPTLAEHVRAEFASLGEDQLLILEGGAAQVGIESTIVDLSRLDQGVGPAVLRPGHITAADIAQVLGLKADEISVASGNEAEADASGMPRHSTAAGAMVPRVSGSLKAHYAPRTPLWVVPKSKLIEYIEHGAASGERVACVSFASPEDDAVLNDDKVDWLVVQEDAVVYARELYALLRRLDGGGYGRLIFEQPPISGSWRAVNDRLARAAAAFLR